MGTVVLSLVAIKVLSEGLVKKDNRNDRVITYRHLNPLLSLKEWHLIKSLKAAALSSTNKVT